MGNPPPGRVPCVRFAERPSKQGVAGSNPVSCLKAREGIPPSRRCSIPIGRHTPLDSRLLGVHRPANVLLLGGDDPELR